MFDEFDTIIHIKNFEKYDVQYERTYYVIFQKKYGTVMFGPCDDNNSRESLYLNPNHQTWLNGLKRFLFI